jgi:hypothetical protein
MHRSVLQNKKYIKFAAENTVEVMSLQDLRKGIDAKDKKAETYTDKDGHEYLVEFPGLTVEQMEKLHGSPAPRYNNTNGIPYTSIVNPHDLKEMVGFSGSQSASTLMDAVLDQRKVLDKEHGRGISRKSLAKLRKSQESIREDAKEASWTKALANLAKLDKDKDAARLEEQIAAFKTEIYDMVGKRLDELEAMIGGDDKSAAERELRSLARQLEGTPLETRANDLLEKAKAE